MPGWGGSPKMRPCLIPGDIISHAFNAGFHLSIYMKEGRIAQVKKKLVTIAGLAAALAFVAIVFGRFIELGPRKWSAIWFGF